MIGSSTLLRLQALAQDGEMVGLFGGDADPVGVILFGHAAKTGGMIQRQIDRRKFDMDDGVQQAGAAFWAFGATLQYLPVRDQFRLERAAADQDNRCRILPIQLAGAPVGGDGCGQRQFLVDFRGGEGIGQRREQRTLHGAGLV